MSNDKGKRAAGYKAAELIQPGMQVGLGTGSTAYYFIEKLIQRCKEGLKISGIATSKKSSDQAKAGGIPLIDPSELGILDIDIDGADEIDVKMQMIKGGGGALFREKIIANAAKEMIVVVDESKLVKRLGKHPLPIEISSFGTPSILKKLENLGVKGILRKNSSELYKTDNGNYILDANLENYSGDLKQLDYKILAVPGVIESGFFWNLAKKVIIGYEEGHAELKDNL
ncbi:MAG: Ribose-5-phosphate isomerase A [Chlamydiae bacterium]|nr:Ribose-5-phosphate isomerase A [Chlamydiota bacterium]